MQEPEQNPEFSNFDISRWTLMFKDRHVEKLYKKEYFEKSLHEFRLSFIIVTLLYAVFGLLDFYTAKTFYKDFYVIRYIIVTPVFIFTWLLSFHPRFKDFWQSIISICFLLGGAGIVYMLYKNPSNIYYYGGMFLVFIAGYFFIKLHFFYALVPALLVILIYNLGGFILNEQIGLENILITNAFYLSANIIAIVALYNLKLTERAEFKQRFLLSKQKDEIKKINENLEALVTERTLLLEKRNLVLNDEIKSRKQIEKMLIRAKQQAEESDRLKSAFLANMSHEIRTPMNGIIGFLDLVSDSDLSKEDRQQYLDIVRKSSVRLLDTLNDIIELSKIEVGELSEYITEINLGLTLNYISEFFSLEFKSKNLEFRIKSKLENQRILTDSSKLESILNNLVKNAIKFTHKGFIELGVEVQEEQLLFYVKDSGIGIPQNRQKAIFDRFVQADLSLSRGYEGSGLGLSICKAYVEFLGGKIWVESELDVGTTFYFTIKHVPAGALLQNADKTKPAELIIANDTPLKVIQIVEDDEVSYNLIETILSSLNIQVLRSTNGLEAIRNFKENKNISLIIMDIKMPVMDGVRATEEIRKLDEKIPIIAQTAYALSGDKENLLKSGFNDYISKPLKKDDLISLIKKYYHPK